MWHVLLPFFLAIALSTSAAEAARGSRRELARVIYPAARSTVPAHPHVNLIVRFGRTSNGAAAEPVTFHARLNGNDLTRDGLFEPIMENGALVGMRAAVNPPLVRVGRRANRLRVEVRSVRGNGRAGRSVRDVDRIRFRVVEAANLPPTVTVLPGSETILPGIPLQFDASVSDPESDLIAFQWDFGDGGTSSEPRPAHTYQDGPTDVLVNLTVSDGQLGASDQKRLFVCPPTDPGRTSGQLRIEAPAPLEFGGVAPGASAERSFTVLNTDPTPTSQLHVRFGLLDVGGFTLNPTELNLAASETAPVTLTFAPTTSGHQVAEIVAVASGANTCVVHLLTHGFGGTAPGTGPTLAPETLFFSDGFPNVPSPATGGIFPSGARFYADNTVHVCQHPLNLPGTGDVCVTDADCSHIASDATCAQSSACIRGDRQGQPCTLTSECPGGFCPSHIAFEPLDMCGDGEGGLFLLSDEDTFTEITEPMPGETERAGSILHVSFDANGVRTGAEIFARTTTQTTQLACDALPAANDGRVYLADFRNVVETANCFREGEEKLAALRKSNGARSVLVDRIDAVEGLSRCEDDYEEIEDLQITREFPPSSPRFAAFVTLPNGVYRIRPSPLLITPDFPSFFGVHPDGSLLFVTNTDRGPTGLIQLYKISPEQAADGAPRLRDLTPCLTLPVPNNQGRTGIGEKAFATAPVSPGSQDAIVLLSFLTSGNGVPPRAAAAISSSLQVRGTVAISSPAGAGPCSVLGFTNLELLDQLTF